MSDFILIDGDLVHFDGTFGPATVTAGPGALKASGPATVSGKPVCVAGDEQSVAVTASYVTPSFTLAGSGTLEIASLAGDQTARKTRSGGALVLLVGSQFTAKLTIQSKAKQPTPAGMVEDPMTTYLGTGRFGNSNTKLKGV